jgi:hypothetical protein
VAVREGRLWSAGSPRSGRVGPGRHGRPPPEAPKGRGRLGPLVGSLREAAFFVLEGIVFFNPEKNVAGLCGEPTVDEGRV